MTIGHLHNGILAVRMIKSKEIVDLYHKSISTGMGERNKVSDLYFRIQS